MNAPPWGKLNSSDDRRHPLADHCLDVATVFRALLDQPRLARMPGLDAVQRDRLAVLAFLHDFGKCNRGFQAKALPQAKETAGHIFEAMALLLELQELWPPAWQALIEAICQWFAQEEQAGQMLVAAISHHGRPVSERDYQNSNAGRSARKWWRRGDGYDPLAALEGLAEACRRNFPRAFEGKAPTIDATPTLQQRFAGLLMLADWIGSDTQFFPFRQSPDEDRLLFAQTATGHALRAIGLIPPDARHARPFTEIFPFSPTPMQAALSDSLDIGDDTRLLLAESDTGSGKTEAALGWFFRLYAAGQVDGLYFALPTRVAARELYERVLRAVHATFAMPPGPVLLAAPGYVKVDGQGVDSILADPVATLWDDDSRDRMRERLWSSERPKRFLAAPIAVGTVDQALLSVLQVKHSMLRSVCLDRHLLVVDEVHASDPYMRAVLKVLLRGHLDRGGHALLLSATLGEGATAEYFGRPCAPLDEALRRPYPMLSTRSRALPMPAARERRIHIELAPSLTRDAEILPRVIYALERGARILVICNTVARANALFRLIEEALATQHPELLSALFACAGVRCPHHGRFTREDRELLDAQVTTQLGKHSPSGPHLLIGTQTLEQSLDIDADWLVTDLAPMDVLIQRLGRLHRHRRPQRPVDFELPQALVRVPERALSEYLRDGKTLRAPAGLGSVYADGRVLARTWEELHGHPVVTLPQQARELIELTTHDEALRTLPEMWRTYGHALIGSIHAEVHHALSSVLQDKPFGDLHYPDKSERITTRLGRPTLDLPLAEPMPSPFGAQVYRVPIPAHWIPEGPLPDTVHAAPTDGGFRFVLGNAAFRYSRFGLEKDDA